MELQNQSGAIELLQKCAKEHCRAIIIDGSVGVGKSYLARQYGQYLNIQAFLSVDPKIDTLKSAIDDCYAVDNDVVFCVENLDLGVSAVAQAILKFLEEPPENVYIVITCRNIRQIPDTILSRAIRVSLPPIVKFDLETYIEQVGSDHKDFIKIAFLDRCIKSFGDIDVLSKLNSEKLQYIYNIKDVVTETQSVSYIVWKFQKFPDSTDTPIVLVIRSLMQNPRWVRPCIQCLDTISKCRVGTHAALCMLAFELKALT